jgi:hypothetical protein
MKSKRVALVKLEGEERLAFEREIGRREAEALLEDLIVNLRRISYEWMTGEVVCRDFSADDPEDHGPRNDTDAQPAGGGLDEGQPD